MFNRDKIIDWLNLSILVAHEIKGVPPGCGSCEITMPSDIAMALNAIGIIEIQFQQIYKYASPYGVMEVKPIRPTAHFVGLKIEIFA